MRTKVQCSDILSCFTFSPVPVTIYPHDKFVMAIKQVCYPYLSKKNNRPGEVVLVEFGELRRSGNCTRTRNV